MNTNKSYILSIDNTDNIFSEVYDKKSPFITDKNNDIVYNNCKTHECYNNQKVIFDDLSIVSKINSSNEEDENITEDEAYFLGDQKSISNKIINRYKTTIGKLNLDKKQLEEIANRAIKENEELKNYIQILKQSLDDKIIKSGLKNIIDKSSQNLNQSPTEIVMELTRLKSENEKIKKNLLLQQVVTTEMKKEIEMQKKENKNLMILNEKLKSSKNNSSILTQELNQNYQNLKNDLKTLSKNNESLMKYNEKILIENEKLKNELNNLKSQNNIDNIGLKIILDKQKNELHTINNTLLIKNSEIENFQKKEDEFKTLEKKINELYDSQIKENMYVIKNIEPDNHDDNYYNDKIRKNINESVQMNNLNNIDNKIQIIKNVIEILFKE